jgi:hypothetical protein
MPSWASGRMPCVRPRPLPLLAVVAASASLAGAGRLWFSALKSDRVVQSPPALHAPPLVLPTPPEPPLVVHAQPVAPPAPKPVVKRLRPHATHKAKPAKAKPAVTGHVGGVSIIVDIGTAESHTETQQPVTPTKPIVVAPVPAHPGSGHGKAKPKPVTPAKPVKPPVPTPTPPVATPAPPVSAPAPPVSAPPAATPTPPAAPPVVQQVPPSSPSPPATPTPPVVTPPTQPTPPVVSTPSPPVVNSAEDESDSRPGNGWGDKNHDHTGPPGQNKKNGG